MVNFLPDSNSSSRLASRLAPICAAVVTGWSVAATAWAQPVRLDGFTDGFGVVVPGLPPINFTAPSAVGGSRTLSLVSGDPAGSSLAVSSLNPGVLSVTSGVILGTMATVTYDRNGAGLGDMDLTVGNQGDAFSMELISIDVGKITVMLTVFSGMSQASLSLTVDEVTDPLLFVFSDFLGYSSTIFENADKVVLKVQTTQETDATLRFRGDLVPGQVDLAEPASLAVFGLGLLAAGIAARRRG